MSASPPPMSHSSRWASNDAIPLVTSGSMMSQPPASQIFPAVGTASPTCTSPRRLVSPLRQPHMAEYRAFETEEGQETEMVDTESISEGARTSEMDHSHNRTTNGNPSNPAPRDGETTQPPMASNLFQRSLCGFVQTESDGDGDGSDGDGHAPTGRSTEEKDGEGSGNGPVKTLHSIYEEITAREFSPRQRFFHIVHGTPVLAPDDVISVALNFVIFVTVVASTVSFAYETLPANYDPAGPQGVFFVLEAIWVSIFTLDLALRFLSATSPWHVLNVLTICDLLSVLGFYISLAYQTGDATSFQILRVLRLARVLRMSKLTRTGVGFALMTKTVKKSKQGLFLLVVLVTIAMVLCSAVIYTVEVQTNVWDPEEEKWYTPDGEESPFQSIPASFWFVLVTLTTVGYGDEVPSSGYGRIIAVMIMVFGVLLLSFPNILIGSTFQTVHDLWNRQRARSALGRRFRFVRYVVRFVRMWREYRKSGQVKLLHPTESGYRIGAVVTQLGQSVYLDRDQLEAMKNEPAASTSQRADVSSAQGSQMSGRKSKLIAGGTVFHQRTVNFFFRGVDYPDVDYSKSFTAFHKGAFDALTIQKLPTVEFLHRLVQVFSCCCTLEEMYESFLLDPFEGARAKKYDLVELSCHLANAGVIELYILNRFDDHVVLFVSKRGMRLLQHHADRAGLTCVRCFEEARDIWHTTTGARAPNVLPTDGFRRWQAMQACIPKRSRLGFVYDLKNPSSRANNVFRGVAISHSKAAGAAAAEAIGQQARSKRRGSHGSESTSMSNRHGASASPLAGPLGGGGDTPITTSESTRGPRNITLSSSIAGGAGPPGVCSACPHCVGRGLTRMATAALDEEELDKLEQLLVLQKELVQGQLEVLRLRRRQLQPMDGGDGDFASLTDTLKQHLLSTPEGAVPIPRHDTGKNNDTTSTSSPVRRAQASLAAIGAADTEAPGYIVSDNDDDSVPSPGTSGLGDPTTPVPVASLGPVASTTAGGVPSSVFMTTAPSQQSSDGSGSSNRHREAIGP